MSLPAKWLSKLSDPVYRRTDPAQVQAALTRLGVSPSDRFVEFYTHFRGPFWSDDIGVQLADMVEDEESIESLTNDCRATFGFPHKFLVLTPLSAGVTVHVLDTETDKVYVVDFEGGERLLIDGELDHTWNSFSDFLDEYL